MCILDCNHLCAYVFCGGGGGEEAWGGGRHTGHHMFSWLLRVDDLRRHGRMGIPTGHPPVNGGVRNEGASYVPPQKGGGGVVCLASWTRTVFMLWLCRMGYFARMARTSNGLGSRGRREAVKSFSASSCLVEPESCAGTTRCENHMRSEPFAATMRLANFRLMVAGKFFSLLQKTE